MPMPAPDFEQLFVDGAQLTLSDGDVVTVRLRQDVSLWLPSGQVVAGEPFMFGADDEYSEGFVQQVSPGQYPLVLVIAEFGKRGTLPEYEMVAAAKLVIRDEPVVSWEMAVYESQDVSELSDQEFFGYPVDGGTGGFVDTANIAKLTENFDDYIDRVIESVHGDETEHTAAGALTDDEGRTLVVGFSSGGGDGHYPTWVGRTADGEVACFITDFFILTDEDDDEDPDSYDGPDYPLSSFAQGQDMLPGQTLRRQSLTSQSGTYTLVHQDDGNIVLYDNVRLSALWASGTDGEPGTFCALRKRGLCLFDAEGRQLWSTGAERSAARLVVRDDGDVVILDDLGAEVWSSESAEIAPEGPAAIGDRMLPGQTLGRQSLTSPSGRTTLAHQDDGNLALYDNEGRGVVWSSGTVGRGTARCMLRADGDFVIYDRHANVVWSTDTAGNPGSVLAVVDDGVELRGPDSTLLWSIRASLGTTAEPRQPSEGMSRVETVQRPLVDNGLAEPVGVYGTPMGSNVRAVPVEEP